MATRVAMIAVRRLRAAASLLVLSSSEETAGSDVDVDVEGVPAADVLTLEVVVGAAARAPTRPAAGSTSVAHESAGGAPTSMPRATRCRSESIAVALE